MIKPPPHRLRFRQVHLDFHTSPDIEGIGRDFDADHWQAMLRRGHVDSITCFATCHHGHAYYNTAVGRRHPHLDFDLLARQFEASKAIDINVPIYLTAGINNWAADLHPEWREIDHAGCYTGWQGISPLEAGYKKMCFNSPYLDLLCEQVREVVDKFPGCDGIFLDIIHQSPCCCRWCMASMAAGGYDPTDADDRVRHATAVMKTYYQRTVDAARHRDPAMPIFHNSSHITPGRTDLLPFFSHLELESLPTGGWGYDHFPLSARYVAQLPHDALGMTGKFHNTWGEFGGYKHPNALRYECAAMIAHGTKCSIGDQLAPGGKLDESTYRLIGTAYAEVQQKQDHCVDAVNVADVGLLCSTAFHHENRTGPDHANPADTGASRLLLESHFLFNVLDAEMDFSPYRLLILPDDIPVRDDLHDKLVKYVDAGGRLLLTGTSCLGPEGLLCRFDLGAELHGLSAFEPDYALFAADLRPDFCDAPLVMYRRSVRLRTTTGRSLGQVYDPRFNRTYRRFSSHQHTPPHEQPSGFDVGVQHGPITCLAHPLFTLYAGYGSVACKQILTAAIRSALGGEPTVTTNLPSNARLTLTHQPQHHRHVLHLLYGNIMQRGGVVPHPGSSNRPTYALEVIEDLPTLHDTRVTLRGLPPGPPAAPGGRVSLPLSDEIAGTQVDAESLTITIPRFAGHQMVVIDDK